MLRGVQYEVAAPIHLLSPNQQPLPGRSLLPLVPPLPAPSSTRPCAGGRRSTQPAPAPARLPRGCTCATAPWPRPASLGPLPSPARRRRQKAHPHPSTPSSPTCCQVVHPDLQAAQVGRQRLERHRDTSTLRQAVQPAVHGRRAGQQRRQRRDGAARPRLLRPQGGQVPRRTYSSRVSSAAGGRGRNAASPGVIHRHSRRCGSAPAATQRDHPAPTRRPALPSSS